MDKEPKASDAQQQDERFISVLKELTSFKDTYIVKDLERYSRAVRLPRRLFQLSSVLVILLSVSIPLLTTLQGKWQSVVLPIVALLVAGLTGLISFFHWESNWKEFTLALTTLQYSLSLWELRIIEAKHEIDAQKAIEIVLQATRQLLDDTRSVTKTEAEEFFKLTQPPQRH